jgi:hypothetical protein
MMKTYFVFWMLVLVLPAFAADPPKYPKKVSDFDALPFEPVAQKQLPPEASFTVSQGAESNEDPDYTGPACYIDLNGDGMKELIVQSQSKTSDILGVFQKQKDRWISILQVWGRASLLAKRNGYYQIELWNTDRHGEGTRALYIFSGRRYHITRIDKYKDETYIGTGDIRESEEVLERNFNEQFKHH